MTKLRNFINAQLSRGDFMENLMATAVLLVILAIIVGFVLYL